MRSADTKDEDGDFVRAVKACCQDATREATRYWFLPRTLLTDENYELVYAAITDLNIFIKQHLEAAQKEKLSKLERIDQWMRVESHSAVSDSPASTSGTNRSLCQGQG